MIVAKLRPSKNNMRPAFRDMTKDTSSQPTYATIEAAIGHTPLVRLQRIGRDIADARGNIVLGKLEGNNPAGSVKDRPALSMIQRAQERGDIAHDLLERLGHVVERAIGVHHGEFPQTVRIDVWAQGMHLGFPFRAGGDYTRRAPASAIWFRRRRFGRRSPSARRDILPRRRAPSPCFPEQVDPHDYAVRHH